MLDGNNLLIIDHLQDQLLLLKERLLHQILGLGKLSRLGLQLPDVLSLLIDQLIGCDQLHLDNFLLILMFFYFALNFLYIDCVRFCVPLKLFPGVALLRL